MGFKSFPVYISAVIAGLNIGIATGDAGAGVGTFFALYVVIFTGNSIVTAIKEQKK